MREGAGTTTAGWGDKLSRSLRPRLIFCTLPVLRGVSGGVKLRRDKCLCFSWLEAVSGQSDDPQVVSALGTDGIQVLANLDLL